MRFFLDAEFIERGPRAPIELISIGLVSENGRELYGVSNEFDPMHANDFVREKVLPHVGPNEPGGPRGFKASLELIAEGVAYFVNTTASEDPKNPRPEFWGYYADYDWVVFCQMFGAMVKLPETWPKYCRDIKQWADALGNPPLPLQAPETEHNALFDARWNRQAWLYLSRVECPMTANIHRPASGMLDPDSHGPTQCVNCRQRIRRDAAVYQLGASVWERVD